MAGSRETEKPTHSGRPACGRSAGGRLGVSVVVPACNEESAVGGVLERMSDTLSGAGLDAEIIVVDDGSHDRTAEVAESVPGVRVVRHARNRGYGAAIKTGIGAAARPLICITDADGTYPNGRIPDLVRHHVDNGCDMTVGARTGDAVAIPLIRRPAKWAIGRLADYIVGEHIPDINSGLRVFRRDLARRMFRILPDGFSLTTTITLAMLTNGFKVAYLPIDYHPRIGRSKIRPIRDTIGFTQLILKMGLYFAPMRIFLPAAGIVFLAGLLWGIYTHFVFGRLADVSTLVIVMAAVQIGALGLLAELINWRAPRSYSEDDE